MSESNQKSGSPGDTTAFFVVAGVSFAAALLAMVVGVWNLDAARVERILAEHDPFRAVS